MKHSFLFVLLGLSFLHASGSSPQEDADYAAIQTSGVSTALYDKIRFGEALNLGDVKALAQAKVKDAIIIRYMYSLCTIYILTNYDVKVLRAAGVSQNLINYMMKTPKLFRPTSYPQGTNVNPYWFGPSPSRIGY